jgi:serine/threonine protein phosphatase 1
MDYERVFVVGDIHGCLNPLKDLISKIDWNPDRDGLIFIGDYVDRGENPKGVVDFLIELSGESPNVRFLLGNHEAEFLDFINQHDLERYLRFGGERTLLSYSINGNMRIPPEHISFLNSLELYIELDEYLIVHAGLQPGVKIQKQDLRDIIWIREQFIYSDYDFGKTVIFGHTPFPAPFVKKNKIGIDTGAVFGNKLTCIELPVEKFHHVTNAY